MRIHTYLLAASQLLTGSRALVWQQDQVGFNLNENQTAVDPLDYDGEWAGHDYFPSPKNWRMPMYTLFLDRFVNGYVVDSHYSP